MERKNTILLTVIAVATLLVAVAGATFAYFTAQNSVEATSTVEVQTSGVSSVTSTATNCSLTIEGTDMLEADANNDGSVYKEATCEIAITGTHPANSSSSEVCTYSMSYTPTTPLTYKSTGATSANKAEVTLSGSASTDEPTYSSLGGTTTLSPIDLYDKSTSQTIVSNGTFTYGGPTPGANVENTVSTATWSFSLKFYNYEFDQNILAGKTFGGTIQVDSFNCVSSAASGS